MKEYVVSVTLECTIKAESGDEAVQKAPESYDDERWKTVDGQVKEA